MMRTLAVVAAAALSLGAAPAPKPLPPLVGYLGKTGPDTYRILPPAPVPGTTRYEADRTTFLATRSLKDSRRWTMAQGDVDSAGLLKGLACAVGVDLTPENAPATARLMRRVALDTSRATNLPKDIYKRQRPYLIDEGPICVDKTDSLAKSPDYPSGHNTWGWTVGLILAEVVPDRATEILVRAKAFGESRLVCGVHNLSAVGAGRMNASIVVAGLHGVPEFRSDLETVRREVAAARKAGPAPDAAACAAEAELTATSPY
ncbi:MAG: phosphatase PAP2 family protein [Phenylobacterium sp.]